MLPPKFRYLLTNLALVFTVAILLPSKLRSAAEQPAAKKKYNVLFLMGDDLRPWLGCYGATDMSTPNLDRLSAKSVRFDAAYCQYPVCNPSRTSMLTGRYPNKTQLILNGIHHFRDNHPDWVTLPQYFKQHGYATINAGKLFHGRVQDPDSWTEWTADYVPKEFRKENVPVSDAPGEDGSVAHEPRFRVLEGNGESGPDYWIADSAIKLLNKYKDQPFFLGVGFHAPHASPTAAKRFYDLYPLEQVKLPPDFATRPTVPPGCPEGMLPKTNDVFYMNVENTPEEAKEVIRGYCAAVSNLDWNFGRILDELERLGLAENTIIVVAGDHGYHNGEKGRWGKTTVFEVAERVPLLIYVPHTANGGKVSARTVQLLDLYPTLAALCGLGIPAELQGNNLAPLLENPQAPWAHPALGMARTGAAIGYTVRTEQFRYAEWEEGKGGEVLFDHRTDPNETINLAKDPKYRETVAEMKALLKKGFGDMPAHIAETKPTYVNRNSPKPEAKPKQ